MAVAKTKNKKKTSLADKVFVVFNTIFMIMFVIVILYPIWYIIASSFSGVFQHEYELKDVLLLKHFSLQNFKDFFSDIQLNGVMINTIIRTVVGTVIGVTANAWLAFILSRKEFRFRRQLSFFWVITIYLECGIIPTLDLYQKLNLTESFWVYIIPGIISGLYVIVMRTYMNQISESMIDEAKMDGASYTQIFTKIVSPICKPIYATVALYIASFHWNAWFDCMLYNRTQIKYRTLGYEIFSSWIMCNCCGTPIGIRETLMLIGIVPMILLSIFLQKHCVTSVEDLVVKE